MKRAVRGAVLFPKKLEAIPFLLMFLGQIHHIRVESNHQMAAINKAIKPMLARNRKEQ